MYNHNTINLTYNASSQSAQKDYTNLLTIGKKYRVSFDFGIDGITTASFTLSNGSTQVRDKLTTITTKEITEFTATATNLTLLATLSAGNYGRLAHIDNLVIEEIFEVGEGYRFGFNGKEKDPEGMGGGGSTYDYGFRIYNPNLGKFLSVDPLFRDFAWYTPYQFAGDKPIVALDLDGREDVWYHLLKQKDGSYLTLTKMDDLNNETNQGLSESLGYDVPRDGVVITELTEDGKVKLLDYQPALVVIGEKSIGQKAQEFYVNQIYANEETQMQAINGLEVTGKTIKATGLLALMFNPVIGAAVYSVGEGLTTAADALKTAVHIENKEYAKAGVELGGFAAGKFAGKTIDKSIPMPDSKNVAAKAAIDLAVDKTKTEVKEAIDNHEGDD